jgi:hypothetical protein
MMRLQLRTVVVRATALVALFALLGGSAAAQVKPFKVTGSGVGLTGLPAPGQDPRPHTIESVATFLGHHTGEGTVKTDSAVFDPATGHITGEFGSGSPFVFVGANGDQLACYYGHTDFGASEPGRYDLTILGVQPDGSLVVEALFIAEFVPVSEECTGKFAGVTGSWIMYAWTEPFVLGSDDPINYSWEGQGSLTFQKK